MGGSRASIRRPVMARSFRLGFLSGLAADAALFGGGRALLRCDPSLAPYVEPGILAAVGISVPAAGLLLTLGCTYVSVGKCLRMRAGDLY